MIPSTAQSTRRWMLAYMVLGGLNFGSAIANDIVVLKVLNALSFFAVMFLAERNRKELYG